MNVESPAGVEGHLRFCLTSSKCLRVFGCSIQSNASFMLEERGRSGMFPKKHRVLQREPGPIEEGFSLNGADDLIYSLDYLLSEDRSTCLAARNVCPPQVVKCVLDICHRFKLNSIIMCHSVCLLQNLVIAPVAIESITLPLVVALSAKLYRDDKVIPLSALQEFLATFDRNGQRPPTRRELFIAEQRILAFMNFDVDRNLFPDLIGALLDALVSHTAELLPPEYAGFKWSLLLRPSFDMAVVYLNRRRLLPDRLRSYVRCAAPAIIIVTHTLITERDSPLWPLVTALATLVRVDGDAILQDAHHLFVLFDQQHPTEDTEPIGREEFNPVDPLPLW